MDIQNFCVKFYAAGEQDIDQSIFIPIFQDWIRDHTLEDLMIDIADYRHVPDGPGMMLICHGINYAMDSAEGGRLGLLAQNKRPQEGDHALRIQNLLRSTLQFVKHLQADHRTPDNLNFDFSGFEYISNDRLLLENSDHGLASVEPDLKALGETLYPGLEISISRRENHSQARLAVKVETATTTSLDDLLQRLN